MGNFPEWNKKGEKNMAYLGEEIKKLGFGLMRLPQKSEGVIDVEQTKVMVDKFMEAGFTYFDTAWAYAGSEDAIREALVERYPREKYQLATKMAAWINCKTRDEALAQFKTSLERTKAGYFDFYLLHNLGEHRTKYFDEYGLWDWIREQKEAGLIRHAGFSFHSTPEELDALLTAHPEMEFVQLQINYADWENPAIQSRACYEVARKHGKPVIIMEPVKGGMLATPPEAVEKLLKEAEPEASTASWAIRFAANLEGVITVLSGMSNVAQMEDNLSFMKDFNGLTDGSSGAPQTLQIHIPAGIDTGKSIRLKGKGMPGTGGGEPGDLLLKVTVGIRPGYERKGSDVYTTISIPYTTAVFGGEATVPTLYGNVICKIREGMQSGSKIRLRGKGIVSMKNPSVRGDQYVTIQIQVPQNLNYSAKEKLHEYAKACGLERSNATGSHVA